MNRLAPLLTLALTALSNAQIPDKKITFSSVGTPCYKLLALLSKQVGVPMSAATSTKDDVLCVRFKDVPAPEAMKRVAETLNCSWKVADGVYVLERSGDQNRADIQAERKALLSLVTRLIAQKRTQASKYKPMTELEMDRLAQDYKVAIPHFDPTTGAGYFPYISKLIDRTPSSQLMPRLVSLLDPQELISLPAGIKVVYSTHPTPIQRELPSNLKRVYEDFVSQSKLWQAAQVKTGIGSIKIGGTSYGIAGLTENGYAEPALIYLTITRRSNTSYNIDLHFVDAAAKEIMSSSDQLGFDSGGFYGMGRRDPNDTSFALELDKEDKEYIAALRPQTNSDNVSPRLREKMLDPIQHEPLGLFTSKWLLQVAEKKDENVVAYLSDNFIQPGFSSDQIPTSEGLLKFWKATESLTESDHWIILRPSKPALNRQSRVNRGFLARYLRSMSSGRTLTIEERASLALELETVESNVLLTLWEVALHINGLPDPYMPYLRLYGTLNTKEKLQAKSKEGLRLSGLNASAVQYLINTVYKEATDVRFDQNSTDTPASQAEQDRLHLCLTSSYYQEPTVFLPTGVPDSGLFFLSEEKNETAYAISSKTGEAIRSFRDTDLAMQILNQTRPDLTGAKLQAHEIVDLNHLAVGKRREIHLFFRFAYGLSQGSVLTEEYRPQGPGTSLSGLPAEFAKRVQELVRQMTKQYSELNRQREQGANRVIPPL